MGLMLRVKQAADFCGCAQEAITDAIASGTLSTRKVPGVAGPHVHADELGRFFDFTSAHILRMFGREADANALEQGAGG